jgi:hypothetical protein
MGEASVSVGSGFLSNGDDYLGDGLTLGASASIPIGRRVSIRIEGHRSFGPPLDERTCAAYTTPCVGAGRGGIRDLTIWTGGLVYYFSSSGVQPFVLGGWDVLHFTAFSDVTYLGSVPIRITDIERTDTTMGVVIGAGVRVPAGPRLFVTPEIGIYDGTVLAGVNLTQVRTSVAIGYRW